MKKAEFEKKIKKLNLQKIYQEDEFQKVFGKLKEIYIDKNTNYIYGCFFEEKQKEYIIFFVDSERGVIKDFGSFKTEEDAYERLFIKINKKI